MTVTVEKLIEVGGREWDMGGHHRVYFNRVDALIGLEVMRYKTGRICCAYLKGGKISNDQAHRLSSGSAYYDVNAGEWIADEITQSLFEPWVLGETDT